MPARSLFAIISFSCLAFLGSAAFADSDKEIPKAWDVYLCPSQNETDESCACSDNSLMMDQEFDLSLLETQGKTYRCLESSELVQKVTTEFNNIQSTVPCNPDFVASLPSPASLVSTFPKGCGYAWKDFNARAYKQTVSTFLKTDRITCDNRNAVNCTSATFLVFLSELKKLRVQRRISPAQLAEWSDLKGPAWKYLNDLARPDLLMTKLKDARGKALGEGKTLHNNEIGAVSGWPLPGDFVQFWRADLSGHSVIFQGFLKDKSGKKIGVCYWSGNYSTNGYGYRCEKLDQIKTMTIGRMKL